MAQNRTTIEELARMIHEGFKGTATKEDIPAVTTRLDGIDSRLEGIDARLDHLDARVGRIEADVHALRDEMVHRREFEDVLDRVTYIEKKLGIESGV
jgi:tetrahydromethanopterin S-methyltransferase subunit G